jgi:nitrogen fixation NifU-like protein
MADLSELYQQVILDHNRKPRNFKVLESPDLTQEGYNPLCGDQLVVYLKMNGEIIEDVSFQGSGCAISKASCVDDDNGRQREDSKRSRRYL